MKRFDAAQSTLGRPLFLTIKPHADSTMQSFSAPRFSIRSVFLAFCLSAPSTCIAAHADEPNPVTPPRQEKVWARTASDSLLPMLALGELVLLTDNRNGKRLAARGAGALVTTFAATTVLKKLFHQKRREREDRDSFPSGHASLSFAMASTLGTYKPNYAVPAYGAATIISLSRLELREHRWRDVVAGAALGFAIGRAWSRRDAGEIRGNTPAVSVGFGW